jgi:hypothetical protein
MGWDMLSRAAGRDHADSGRCSRSARLVVWLLVMRSASPSVSGFFARGFRSWSGVSRARRCRPFVAGVDGAASAIRLVLFRRSFSIGLLLGYLRYRGNSTWLTVFVHGLNNLAAVIQSIWLAGQ